MNKARIKVRIIDDWDYHTNGAIKHDGEKGIEEVDLLVTGVIDGWEDMQELITSLQLIQGRLVRKENPNSCKLTGIHRFFTEVGGGKTLKCIYCNVIKGALSICDSKKHDWYLNTITGKTKCMYCGKLK